MQLVSFWKEIPHKQTPKLEGGKKRFFETKESLPHIIYPERAAQIQMPRLQKALKPDAGLEGLDLRGRGRKREGLAAWEETRLAANLNDFPSVLTSSPIISSQLFLAGCEETKGGWARRNEQTGNLEAGLRDHAVRSGKPLGGFRPLSGCPLPQLSDRGLHQMTLHARAWSAFRG